MFCKFCGAQNTPGATFCANCGAPLPAQAEEAAAPTPATPAADEQPAKGLAIASMVLGIVSLLLLPYVTGTVGIILGAVAKNKGNKGGMATAGIVCGIIGVALWLVMIIACSSVRSALL